MPASHPSLPGRPLKVLKFGGSSVADGSRIRQVVSIVQEAAQEFRVIVVVSALGGVTNELLTAAHEAASGNEGWRGRLDQVVARHRTTRLDLSSAGEDSPTAQELRQLLERDLSDLLRGTALVREASLRTLDAILSHGERCSATLVALALNEAGVLAQPSDAREFLVTSDQFGNARVLREPSDLRIRERFQESTEIIPVVTGFLGATERGETSTLGRGGSDYTAAVLGAALLAERIEIWTDVDGVMTANPRVVPRAFSLPEVSYAELMELSHFGTKVVYPPTVQPARDAGIPLVIRNTFNPAFPGTLIRHGVPPSAEAPIRGISSVSGVALLRLEGDGIVGVPGTAQRLFGTLGQRGINVILISQASSERSICLAVDPHDVEGARRAVSDEFALERQIGLMDELVVEEECSLVAVVGEGMRTQPGIAGRVFRILGGYGINLRAIAQGSSELNLSVAVAQSDEAAALRAIHDAFFFPGERSGQLFVAGTGRVGRAFLEQLAERTERLRENRGIHLTLQGLARRGKTLLDPEGIDPAHAQTRLNDDGMVTPNLESLVEAALRSVPRPAIFVDLTADEAPPADYERLLKGGVAVVTANKQGLSGPSDRYAALLRAALRGGGLYPETTVGAALPILRTLTDLVATGDRVERVEGVISGTLSVLAHRLMEGVPFSVAVREVHRLGYSEPDPRDNLSGVDVGRKLLILARASGFDLEPESLEVEPLLPELPWREMTLEDFWEALPGEDAAMATRVEALRAQGLRLVYLAEITPNGGRVSLQGVGPEHPAFRLPTGDNLVAIHSRNYSSSPLLVQGPGAGPEVTAAGVLAEILRATLETL